MRIEIIGKSGDEEEEVEKGRLAGWRGAHGRMARCAWPGADEASLNGGQTAFKWQGLPVGRHLPLGRHEKSEADKTPRPTKHDGRPDAMMVGWRDDGGLAR